MATYTYKIYKKQVSYDGGITWEDTIPYETMMKPNWGEHCEVPWTSKIITRNGYTRIISVGSTVTTADTVPVIGTDFGDENRFFETLIIGNGLEEIGDWVFETDNGQPTTGYVSSFNSVVFDADATLKSIGDFSFMYQRDISNDIVFPDSLESVGDYSFRECKKIKNITFGSNIKTIGALAFQSDYDTGDDFWSKTFYFNSIVPPTLGSDSLGGAPYTALAIVPNGYANVYNNSWGLDYFGRVNIAITPGKTASGNKIEHWRGTIQCDSSSEVTAIDEPLIQSPWLKFGDCVTSIGANACSGDVYLQYVEFGDYLTNIGSNAFSGCKNLKHFLIPNTVTSIGSGAFNNCCNLTSITIPTGVTTIGNNTFAYCSGLTSIVIPSGVTSIGEGAFNGCTTLTSITFEGSSRLTSIGDSAFYGCSSLTSINIPNSVSTIGNNVFGYCEKLRSVEFGSGLTNVGNTIFYMCNELREVTYNSITPPTFGDFQSINSELTFVPDESILEYKKLTYPVPKTMLPICAKTGIPSIGEKYKYYSLNSNGVAKELGNTGSTTLTSADTAYDGTQNYAVVGDYITSIGEYTFGTSGGCWSDLRWVDIHENVVSIHANAFGTIPSSFGDLWNENVLDGMILRPLTPPSIIVGKCYGVLYRDFPIYVQDSAVNAYKNAWESMSDRIFSFSSIGLTTSGCTPPEEAKWVATYSDSHTESAECSSSSEEIVLDEITNTDLVGVTIGSCVTTIGSSAFWYSTGLTNVNIPDSVTFIGGGAFGYCTGLTNVNIGSGVSRIVHNAFEHCTSLSSVTITAVQPPQVNYDEDLFSGCTNLTSIYVPCESLYYYRSASGWKEYASIIIGIPPCQPVYKIRAVFSDSSVYEAECTEMGGFITRDDIEAIGIDSKNDCNTSASIEIGNCIESIGSGAFSGKCITDAVIPNSVTSIGDGAFQSCSLTSCTIGNGITEINREAFRYCTSLTSITINATTPPLLYYSDAFEYTNDCPIYVPAASVDAYKSASGWSTFASRIQEKP